MLKDFKRCIKETQRLVEVTRRVTDKDKKDVSSLSLDRDKHSHSLSEKIEEYEKETQNNFRRRLGRLENCRGWGLLSNVQKTRS